VPEGDTVWLTARRLDQALTGRVVTSFDLRVPQLATCDRIGQTITAVSAVGKHLLIRFDGGTTLHNHLRMDGSWYLTAAGGRSATGRSASRRPAHQIRALIGNAEWLATGYRIHDLKMVPTTAEGELVGHLGPDLLGPDWDPVGAVARLEQLPERTIGDALLDQRNLAGIGNMYKSELLYLERVHPWTPVGAVANLPRMVDTAHRLLWINREHPEQSTTGLLARGQQHWVYLRQGQPCRTCGQRIQMREQGVAPQQRVTYWCPTCQPAPER
jgi:endonuclease-8